MSLSSLELEYSGYLGRDDFFELRFRQGNMLTYDDVTLATNLSHTLPWDADTTTRLGRLVLRTPIVSSDMDTVTEAQMAIAMATNGWIGMIHYNMSREEQVRQIAQVKHHIHGVISSPITVHRDMTVDDLLALKEEKWYTFGTFPVVDSERKLEWLISSSHISDIHRWKKIWDIMTPRDKVGVISESELGGNPLKIARDFFDHHPGKNKLPIVDQNNTLKWLITLSDVQREMTGEGSAMARDGSGRLLVWVSLQTLRDTKGKLIGSAMREYVERLLAEWADALLISSAHAHTGSVLETVRFVKKITDEVTLIVGNVTSAGGVIDLADAGADVVKIGQWPGSICTTRRVAGVGIPQLSAVYLAAKAAAEKWVYIIADGGIQASGDMVKAFAAGADAVMLWSLLWTADEAPWEIFEIDWKRYKAYRGMWSTAAMQAGSAARYGHKAWTLSSKTAPEWVEAMKAASWPVWPTLSNLVGGIRSWMGYLGAATLPEIREKARFVQMTWSGGRESWVHDVMEVRKG